MAEAARQPYLSETGDRLVEDVPVPLTVETWVFDLDLPKEVLASRAECLSPAEKERAARFHFDVHRNRYIAGRSALREVLASILDCNPAEISFCSGAAGKPSLAPPWDLSNLQFNISHSKNCAAIAVTFGAAVGIDIEEVVPLPDFSELVNRFFCPSEAAKFAALQPNQRAAAFFNLWTRKEALLKATGEGIAHCLNLVEVTFLQDDPPQLTRSTPGLGRISEWSLIALPAPSGFAAALAVRNPNIRLRHQESLNGHLFHPSLTDL